MPKIKLKPNSAEFEDHKKKVKAHRCEMPGCALQAEHKAPKDRSLSEYYQFCIDHVREYNKAWNFFSGMSSQEVEDHMINSIYGHRPTWRYDNHTAAEDILRRKAEETATGKQKQEQKPSMPQNSPEFEALAILCLEPPVDLAIIKKTYKNLVKKYHPDLNLGCKTSEERLKQINMAYTILKLAYDQFEKLPERG